MLIDKLFPEAECANLWSLGICVYQVMRLNYLHCNFLAKSIIIHQLATFRVVVVANQSPF